jgi:hypothetical protein
VSSRVSLAGTSNIHTYTASTTAARVVRLQVASSVLGADVWDQILKPGALESFEIAIPAATLSSPKDGLDKNMHKALKVTEANFTVTGELQLLMTDFGITPPKAMLGMLKTDPKITVTFETVFGIPLAQA